MRRWEKKNKKNLMETGTSSKILSPAELAELADKIKAANSTGNPLAVLSLNEKCTRADIRTAYLSLAFKLHPDKTKGNKSYEEAFKIVGEVYAKLSTELAFHEAIATYIRIKQGLPEKNNVSQQADSKLDEMLKDFMFGTKKNKPFISPPVPTYTTTTTTTTTSTTTTTTNAPTFQRYDYHSKKWKDPAYKSTDGDQANGNKTMGKDDEDESMHLFDNETAQPTSMHDNKCECETNPQQIPRTIPSSFSGRKMSMSQSYEKLFGPDHPKTVKANEAAKKKEFLKAMYTKKASVPTYHPQVAPWMGVYTPNAGPEIKKPELKKPVRKPKATKSRASRRKNVKQQDITSMFSIPGAETDNGVTQQQPPVYDCDNDNCGEKRGIAFQFGLQSKRFKT